MDYSSFSSTADAMDARRDLLRQFGFSMPSNLLMIREEILLRDPSTLDFCRRLQSKTPPSLNEAETFAASLAQYGLKLDSFHYSLQTEPAFSELLIGIGPSLRSAQNVLENHQRSGLQPPELAAQIENITLLQNFFNDGWQKPFIHQSILPEGTISLLRTQIATGTTDAEKPLQQARATIEATITDEFGKELALRAVDARIATLAQPEAQALLTRYLDEVENRTPDLKDTNKMMTPEEFKKFCAANPNWETKLFGENRFDHSGRTGGIRPY